MFLVGRIGHFDSFWKSAHSPELDDNSDRPTVARASTWWSKRPSLFPAPSKA